MTTLQEYLDQKYPTREEKEKVIKIDVQKINGKRERKGIIEKLEGDKLDLREYKNVKRLNINKYFENYFDNDNINLRTPITELNVNGCTSLQGVDCSNNSLASLDLSSCVELKKLCCYYNNFASVDFLKTIPNPKKLESLVIFSNDIYPTNIAFFGKFINLRELRLGNTPVSLKKGKYNRFYGSFEDWKDLNKLRRICIEATDVNSGLEYLSESLVQATKGRGASDVINCILECSTHNTGAKCSAIQNELRPYNYDLEAWQLAHPHLMHKARPELFEQLESREKWLRATKDKIEKTQTKLLETQQTELDKIKRIKRLQSKVRELELIQKLLEERVIFEDSLNAGVRWYDRLKEDKATQTNEVKIQDQLSQTEQEHKIPGSLKWK